MRVKQELNKKLNKMTCKDCIYFNSTEHPKPEWVGYNKCEKHHAEGYKEYVGKDSEVCEDFESDSWEGVSK